MKNITSILIISSLSWSFACDSAASDSTVKQDTKGAKPHAAAAEQVDLTPVVDSYDAVRAALARDDFGAATSGAKKLQDAARKASLEQVASLAEALAKTEGKYPDVVRAAFGGVSRGLISKLAERKDMQERLHVFECPMAKGFGKWVQRDEKLQNPYMGKAMLACGGTSNWRS